jgi:hypothetical protein
MIANQILEDLLVVVFILAKSLLHKSGIKAFLLSHLHQQCHLLLVQLIVVLAPEPVEELLRVDFFFSLINNFLDVDALSEKILVVMCDSIVVIGLILENALGVFLLYLVEFLSVLLLLEEQIIVDAFQLEGVKVNVTLQSIKLWKSLCDDLTLLHFIQVVDGSEVAKPVLDVHSPQLTLSMLIGFCFVVRLFLTVMQTDETA